MHEDFRRGRAGLGLETNAQPAVAALLARGHCIGKNEKGAVGAAGGVETFEQQRELMIQHGLQPSPAHVPFRRTVERVAYGHVVGADGFGH